MLSLRQEISSLTRPEKVFIFFAMLTGFCISGEYGIIRPASQSIFLAVFSASFIPAFWLATVPLNLVIVYLYNHFLPRIGPLRMVAIASIAIASMNLLCFLVLPIFPQIIFFHACWKDVYILLMFKQLWSMIHSTLAASRAKYIFGFIFGVGTCGAALGSLVPGYLAPHFGSSVLLLFSVPIYCLLFYAYRKAYYLSGANKLASSIESNRTSANEGFLLILRNRYISGILLLVMFMQISIALVDFQFSHYLELLIPALDLRTAYFGKLISVINVVSLVLQFVGGFLLLKLIGLRNSHFFIPLILCTTAFGQWLLPSFAMVTIAYSLTKSIDYSIFGVMREMLFLPLKLDEKYRAKAVIDVFAHRTSKALASFLLLGLQWVVGSQVFSLANYLLFVIFLAWLAIVAFLFKKSELMESPANE
jgi:ATP:ADP antiporter, AAA family